MGRFPRKCKLRGPGGVTGGYLVHSLHISPGPNWENPAKSGNVFSFSPSFFTLQTSEKIWAKSSENLSNLKFSEIWRKN